MSKSVVIIGGGIAGLAAGCYARMNGFETTILEMHSLPGGLCTAWQRGAYTFDGCIHYLLGSGTGQPFNRVWQELGALQGRTIINHDEFMRVRGSEGQTLIIYTDPDRLEKHMMDQWPADAARISSLAEGIRQFAHFDMSSLFERPRSTLGLAGWAQLGMGLLAYVPPLMQWAYRSAADFAGGFKDPFLRRAVAEMFAWPDIPMLAGLSLLAYMSTGNAGFPAGASLEFAQSIERRYRDLGGMIEYSAEVARILVEEDASGRSRAVGVRLYDDREYRGDYVISAADGRGTVFDMLDGRFVNAGLKRLYDGHMPVHSQFQVSLGVNRDMSAEPHWVTYLLDRPVQIAEAEHDLNTGQALLLRSKSGASGQVGGRGHVTHPVRILAAHRRPSPLRQRADPGIRHRVRLPGDALPGHPQGHRGVGRGDATQL